MVRDLLELNSEFAPVRAISDRPGWRDEAVNKALHAGIYYGEGEHILTAEIRRHCQGCTIIKLWPDRVALYRFLREKAAGARSLLAGKGYSRGTDARSFKTLFDWIGLHWQEASIEVVLAPDWGDEAVCFGWDEQAVRDFAGALVDYAKKPTGRSLCYRDGWENAPDLDEEIGKVTWDSLVLAPALMQDLREAIEGFFQNRAAFQALGFSWKRGVLLIGPPGTGKTMICKAAAAAQPDLPLLYVRNLGSGGDKDDIRDIFERARWLAPCMLVFEDMDGFIAEHNRTVFLNEMDGFQNNEGLLVIASSNHPGKIDEALLKRPSRFDRVFHIGLPAETERREYCRRVLSSPTMAACMADSVNVNDLAVKAAEASEGFTPAYLKEALISAALTCAQAGSAVLDERFAKAVLAQVAELKSHMRRMKNPNTLADMQSEAVLGFRH